MKTIKRHLSFTFPIASLSLVALLGSQSTLANGYTDYAKVTEAVPIYETIRVKKPHKQCHLEERVVHQKSNRSATPKILGALIGGAIGNELGHNKSNKRVGALAGAILGGSIASDIARNSHHRHSNQYTKTERVCHTTHTVSHEKQLNGYEVSYRYKGNTYQTFMHNHPGKRIRVAVDVRPLDE